MLQLERDVSW